MVPFFTIEYLQKIYIELVTSSSNNQKSSCDIYTSPHTVYVVVPPVGAAKCSGPFVTLPQPGTHFSLVQRQESSPCTCFLCFIEGIKLG